MDALLIVRQGLLFLHLIAFAVAVAEILRGDWRLLRAPRLDFAALEATARIVGLALVALWATGLGLVVLDVGLDPAAIVAKPKLVTKLIVVTALTANGILLHHYAFPMLHRGTASASRLAVIAALGAISTVSWLYAAFVGSARLIAGAMTLEAFLVLYGVGLAVGVMVAALAVAPMLRVRLEPTRPRTIAPIADEAAWAADPEGRAEPEVAERRRA